LFKTPDTGILVSDEWVLTTAHCINKIGSSGAQFFEIVLGTNVLRDGHALPTDLYIMKINRLRLLSLYWQYRRNSSRVLSNLIAIKIPTLWHSGRTKWQKCHLNLILFVLVASENGE
jgi:hypothetical protein